MPALYTQRTSFWSRVSRRDDRLGTIVSRSREETSWAPPCPLYWTDHVRLDILGVLTAYRQRVVAEGSGVAFLDRDGGAPDTALFLLHGDALQETVQGRLPAFERLTVVCPRKPLGLDG